MKRMIAALIFVFFAGSLFSAVKVVLEKFPSMNVEDLNENRISFPVDDNMVKLVTVSFSKPEDGLTESFTTPFYSSLSKTGKVTYYEVAIMGGLGFLEGFIKGAIRGGTSEERRSHVVLCFEDKDEKKKLFSVEDDKLLHVILLDRNNEIVMYEKTKNPGDGTEGLISKALELIE